MIDVLLFLLALCLIPAALIGLALGLSTAFTIIGTPCLWVLERIVKARRRHRFKKRRTERNGR